jgi:hypothetical protein
LQKASHVRGRQGNQLIQFTSTLAGEERTSFLAAVTLARKKVQRVRKEKKGGKESKHKPNLSEKHCCLTALI